MSETLAEILHPEIVLGRRGEENTISEYKFALNKIKFTSEGWETELPMALANSPLMHHFLLTKKFVDERPPVYRLGKDFASVLADIDNDIPVDKLPQNFFGYISLPRGAVTDDTGDVYGAYVFIGDAKYTALHPSNYGQRIMWISTVGDSGKVDGERDFSVSHLLMKPVGSFDEMFLSLPLSDDNLMESSLLGPGEMILKKEVSKKDVDQRLRATRCIVNAVLYIHSLEPNIDHLKPMSNLTHGDRKKVRATGRHINLCTIPVIAVNWSYKKERIYGMDETWRREHTRWQRCGPQFSQIKLVTIRGHAVKYKKHDAIITGGSHENHSSN